MQASWPMVPQPVRPEPDRPAGRRWIRSVLVRRGLAGDDLARETERAWRRYLAQCKSERESRVSEDDPSLGMDGGIVPFHAHDVLSRQTRKMEEERERVVCEAKAIRDGRVPWIG